MEQKVGTAIRMEEELKQYKALLHKISNPKGVEELGVHDHPCLIYETHEEQFSAIVPFFLAGLERHEKCVYIADDNTIAQVLEAMANGGIDTEGAVRSGALTILSKRDAYLKQGYFDPDWMIRFLKEAVDSAKADGYRALRASGEMTWVLGGEPGADRAIEYEAKLNYFFPKNDVVAICQYNLKRFKPDIVLDAIRTHPLVIYRGQVYKNFYYVPPDELLLPDQDYLEVDRLLHNIIRRERVEELRRQAEAELHRYDSILDAVRFAAEEFLCTRPCQKFDEMLCRLGEATEVSRVCIFENSLDGQGRLISSECHEWTAEGIPSRKDGSGPGVLPLSKEGFGRWAQIMSRGGIIHGHVKDLPESERAFLAAKSIRSIMAVPIFVKGSWWGFIGFDECLKEREWFAAEIDAMKAAAGTLGAAVQRRKIEEELMRSAELLTQAQKVACIGSWEWDIANNETRWSEGLYNIFGIEPERFKTGAYGAFLSCVHPGDREWVEKAVKKAFADKEPFNIECRIIRPDGAIRTIHTRAEVTCDIEGAPVKMLGTSQDITDRKLSEEKIKESEEKFRVIFEYSNDGLLLADPDTLRFYIGNEKIRQMLGYSEEELKGLGALDIHPRKDVPFISGQFEQMRKGGSPPTKDIAVKRKDGSIFYADITNSRIRLSGKDFILGAFRDITERKQTEDELNRYKSNLEAIFRSVKDAIVTVSLDLSVLEANEAAERLCGISRDDIGKPLSSCGAECSRRCLDALRETISGKRPVEASRFQCQKLNKPLQTVTLTAYPLLDDKGRFSGAVLVARDETRLACLESGLAERKKMHNITGRSKKLLEIFRLIENLADIDTTVLITGESGTGKELAAEALHYSGIRSDKPLVKVNCSAIAEHLLESELFGHVKGAFTGAVRDRVGRFQLADGGTIFLDEIGDISSEMQLRLLRVIQEKEFERLGDSKTVKADIRIIAATNRNLIEKVRRGEFREDLYYRLNVVELRLPPLRDRMEDLPLLQGHFLKKFSEKFKRNLNALSADVQKIFLDYNWPGNIRELEHAIEHAFILCRGNTIGVSHLPPSFHGRAKGTAQHHRERSCERESILHALESSSWNKSKAAHLLGMSRRTIYRKMEVYGIGQKM